MITYELWAHRWTAHTFAVRLHGGRVTGICGPLRLRHVERWNLAVLPYDDRPEALYRAQAHPEQFMMVVPWLSRYRVPVTSSRRKLLCWMVGHTRRYLHVSHTP